MNYVYLLKEHALGPLTDKQEKAVRVMDVTSRRLVEMVRHYLNLSRIERGTMNPMKKRLAVRHDVLSPLVDTHEPELRAHEMSLDLQVDDQLRVFADETMLAEVFENLISNAIKYGRDGGTLSIKADVEGPWARFTVRNDGDGIPRERLGSLFQKFVRLEESTRDRSVKGTGLGLFITKAIVEAHGGTIEATSEPGQWAAFTFTVPLHDKEATSAAARSETNNPEGRAP
jgi:signal transduction histidine kinase